MEHSIPPCRPSEPTSHDVVVAELSHRLANELGNLCAGLRIANKHIVGDDIRRVVARAIESAEAFGRTNRALCQVARPGSTELHIVLDDALDPLRPILANSGISLSLVLGSGKLANRQAWVVSAILIETIFNALKHSSPLCNISITGDVTDHSVFLTVVTVPADPGRVCVSEVSQNGGTGMGLMLCHRLAAMIGGTLKFETSAAGQAHTSLAFELEPTPY